MSFMYCPSCGTKIEYTLNKPNFCMNCGEKFNASAASPPIKEESISSEVLAEKKYLNIQKIDVDIINHSEKPSTFGEVLSSRDSGIKIQRPAYKVKTDSVVKDITESCKTSKPKDFDDGG